MAGEQIHDVIAVDAGDLPNLVSRVASGDRQAFTALYDVLAPRVYRLAHAMLADPDAACDVVRDTFVDIWSAASGCATDRDGPLSWAMGIAYRRAAHRTRAPVPAGASGATSRHLNSLTRDQHAAIMLSVHGELTCGQVARVVAGTPRRVAVAQRDGLIHLRDAFATGDIDARDSTTTPWK